MFSGPTFSTSILVHFTVYWLGLALRMHGKVMFSPLGATTSAYTGGSSRYFRVLGAAAETGPCRNIEFILHSVLPEQQACGERRSCIRIVTFTCFVGRIWSRGGGDAAGRQQESHQTLHHDGRHSCSYKVKAVKSYNHTRLNLLLNNPKEKLSATKKDSAGT